MVTTATTDEQLITSKEAAKRLGWAEQTLRRKRSQGEDTPDFVPVGKFRMYRPSDVQAWIDARVVRPAKAK